jgi:DNA-binding transcriptional ArsR family regulator
MPISLDDRPAPSAPSVSVGHSDVTELYFATCRLRTGLDGKRTDGADPGDPPLPDEEGLARRLATFWQDGPTFGSELLALAWNAGTFFASAEAFLDSFPEAVRVELPGGGFEHETDDDRETIRRRLRVLAHEPARAASLLELMRELWSAIEPAVRAAAPLIEAEESELRAALRETDDPASILPERHIVHRYGIEPEVRAAARAGRLVITPSVFAGARTSFLELPGALTIGLGVGQRGDGARRRKAAQVVATRLKLLSDPRRVEALLLLGERAYSVSDLAREMGLAQPTISVHVKMLREAGLLRAEKAGGRTSYHADAERLRTALAEVGQILETS